VHGDSIEHPAFLWLDRRALYLPIYAVLVPAPFVVTAGAAIEVCAAALPPCCSAALPRPAPCWLRCGGRPAPPPTAAGEQAVVGGAGRGGRDASLIRTGGSD
jgi:hypothetical protein